jgi:Transcriptional Coactivator p15 (PC4)
MEWRPKSVTDTTVFDGRIIYRFAKNSSEEVLAYTSSYKGFDLINLRVFVANGEDVDVPTPKGIALRVDRLPELRAAVDALSAAVEEGAS